MGKKAVEKSNNFCSGSSAPPPPACHFYAKRLNPLRGGDPAARRNTVVNWGQSSAATQIRKAQIWEMGGKMKGNDRKLYFVGLKVGYVT